MTRSRTQERGDLADEVRIRLLERDADETDEAMADFARQLRKIVWLLVGMLISVTTASIVMVVNVAALGRGG